MGLNAPGSVLHPLEDRVFRSVRVAEHEPAVFDSDADASAVKLEERCVPFVRGDLRVVSKSRQFGAGFGGETRRFSDVLDFSRKQRRRQRLRRRIRRVEYDQPPGSQERFQPSAKRDGHADTRRVRLAKPFEQAGSEFRRGQRRSQEVEGSRDGRVQLNVGHRAVACPGRVVQGDPDRTERSVEHVARLHLVPVVIFRINPEDGDGRHVMFGGGALGQSNGGQGLEQREERPSEQPGLLAGDDGDGSRISKQAAGGDSLRGSRSRALLRGYDVSDGIALARVPLDAGDGVAPRGRILGIPGEEPRDARVVARIVGRELLDPGKPPYVDGNAGDGLGEACLGRH